jgi:RNA polymerase sigma-70 factor (ECF subfamily)
LPSEQRALLVLHHVERVPLADIARALGIPSGTVKSRLHTARRALEAALEVEA